MTGCDLRNRHEKLSAPAAFSFFFAIKIKISGNDVMLFCDIIRVVINYTTLMMTPILTPILLL